MEQKHRSEFPRRRQIIAMKNLPILPKLAWNLKQTPA